MSDEDDRVRASMLALREHDPASVPSFARVRAAAERRVARSRKRRAIAWTSTVALAAIVLLGIWLGREPELGPAPSFADTEPLAFLLEPPSASVVSGASHLERSW